MRTCKRGSRREGNQLTGLEATMRKRGGKERREREEDGTGKSNVVQASEKEHS